MPRCEVQTGCAHRGERLLMRLGAASPPAGRTSSPEEAALSTAQGGLCAKRQSFRVSCGRRERSCVPERASTYIFRGSVRPTRAPHRFSFSHQRARCDTVSVRANKILNRENAQDLFAASLYRFSHLTNRKPARDQCAMCRRLLHGDWPGPRRRPAQRTGQVRPRSCLLRSWLYEQMVQADADAAHLCSRVRLRAPRAARTRTGRTRTACRRPRRPAARRSAPSRRRATPGPGRSRRGR